MGGGRPFRQISIILNGAFLYLEQHISGLYAEILQRGAGRTWQAESGGAQEDNV